MTLTQAVKEATEVAKRDGIKMVVTFNRYAEADYEWQKYSYHPDAARHIFKYERVIDTIEF